MIRIGTVTGSEILKNRNGTLSAVLLQVRITDADDIQTVQYLNPAGEDANPAVGSLVVILDLGPAFKVAIGVQDSLLPLTDPGERRLYSQDNGTLKAFIELLKTGIINLNGSDDFAVRFNALETGLNQLVTDINTALGGKLDGSGTPGTLVLDISGAKVDEVKLP